MMLLKNLSGSGISLTLILQRHLTLSTQENHDKPQNRWCPGLNSNLVALKYESTSTSTFSVHNRSHCRCNIQLVTTYLCYLRLSCRSWLEFHTTADLRGTKHTDYCGPCPHIHTASELLFHYSLITHNPPPVSPPKGTDFATSTTQRYLRKPRRIP